jgi:phosphate transport system substrate-binding protein
MAYALVQNAAGNYPAPDDVTFKAAAANAEWSKSYYQILTNQAGKDAWPLTGATFLLLQAKPENMAKTQSVLKFVSWAFKSGDKTAEDLDYVPMPANVKTLIEKSWAQIK